jgi:hypothetical protein
MTTILPIVQTLDYVLLLILFSALWVKVVRRQEIRAFWFLLASALTTNLLGNIAWILHDMTTDRPLGAFSFIDLFYVLDFRQFCLNAIFGGFWKRKTPYMVVAFQKISHKP